jgi:hypothetical protein
MENKTNEELLSTIREYTSDIDLMGTRFEKTLEEIERRLKEVKS